MNSRTSGRLAFAVAAILCASGLSAAGNSEAVAGKKVNINQASAKELVNLPRIGAYVTLSGPTTLAERVSSKGTRGGSAGGRSARSARNSVPVGKGR